MLVLVIELSTMCSESYNFLYKALAGLKELVSSTAFLERVYIFAFVKVLIFTIDNKYVRICAVWKIIERLSNDVFVLHYINVYNVNNIDNIFE